MVSTAQAVPREHQLTSGCTRLQELAYFCMLQSTQQFYYVCIVRWRGLFTTHLKNWSFHVLHTELSNRQIRVLDGEVCGSITFAS
jgi:hypothetical protein